MKKANNSAQQLHELRHSFGAVYSKQKETILRQILTAPLHKAKEAEQLYDSLCFMVAYPDSKIIKQLAEQALDQLRTQISQNDNLQYQLYNSGLPGTALTVNFGFEMSKWLRHTHRADVQLDSFAAEDGQITSILSAVMPQVESEILQDENSTWREWLHSWTTPHEDLLDALLSLFDQSPITPEVKDELWTALGVYLQVKLSGSIQLPDSLVKPFYHRSLRKKAEAQPKMLSTPIKLQKHEAEQIINSARMMLVGHLREIDPISFCDADGVEYHHLQRGLSIALFYMRPERRHPLDSYIGYMVFKNGLPFGYAGSWVLFDSARIGLNIFPSFRGGESQQSFADILSLHQKVFSLDRFTADPYQIGKNNADGIKSGAFWLYYKLGFRPIRAEQHQLAEEEYKKIKATKGYRTSPAVLKKLADSRMQFYCAKPNAVSFDATDLSIVFANIVRTKYSGNRRLAVEDSYQKLTKLLNIKQPDNTLRYVFSNWCLLLMADEKAIQNNAKLRADLAKIFALKATEHERAYIFQMQKCTAFRMLVENSIALHLNAN